MNRDSFLQRVQALRDSWSERRQLRALASSRDFDSQLQLLRVLHRWAREAVEDIRAVYGGDLDVRIDPEPAPGDPAPAFTVSIAPGYSVALELVERRRGAPEHWFVSVTLNAAGPAGSPVATAPQRRTGQWTRGQLEELILTALGAYERAVSSGDA